MNAERASLRREREKDRQALVVLVCALALAALTCAWALWLASAGCARKRAPQNRALAENVRRGVYPAEDWDAAEFGREEGKEQ
ncbi:MAG TPA: hypothetical protein P5026_07805 [Kiritimatiellia bacterium]|nr:hypothetical protein [Kiritimatiellia bacterium]HRU70195.1 hypothetical protein [Kiritimatiellia bacterium]